MNTSNNDLKEILLEKLEDLKNFLYRNIRIVLPAVLIVCVLITVIVAVNAGKHTDEESDFAADDSEMTSEDSVAATMATPVVALEENAHAEVNEFIEKYYGAMASGDIEQVLSMNNYIDDTEKIRIEENAKYIEKYHDIDVYTKVGPVEGSYVAYVYSEIKFKDYDTLVPGMQAYYLCTDDNNNLYINDGEESASVTAYIREASLQDDVVDLNNKVAVQYNDMLAEDENLSAFLVDLTDTIGASVGETLAKAEGSTDVSENEEETEQEPDAVMTKVTKVKATDVVNIRSSDSETADKLGKARVGDEFTLLEERGNGWSKIEYQNKEAFIKSDYLEAVKEEVVVAKNNAEDQTQTSDDSNAETKGTVTVKENVRIRAGASENSDRLGTAYVGEKFDVIMKQADGWTKIKYKGKTAYVKSEYVE